MKLASLIAGGGMAAVLLIMRAANTAADAPPAPPPAAQKPATSVPEKPGWKLTFDDEFDGKALDTAKWIDSYPDGVRTHGNQELQYYAPDGYRVNDGRLHLIGERRAMAGHEYTSGIVTSYGKFAQKYGWFEARVRVPRGKGYWPAFWLLPSDKTWPPEIDVLEVLDHEPNKVYLTNHWRDDQGKHKSHGGSFTGPDFSQDFHTFAVDWEPGLIVWYVDGVERFRSTEGVPDTPMYVIANLAVGGDWPGNPDATTPFPGSMDIDYVRVYQKKDVHATTPRVHRRTSAAT